jgi:AcrR family transcriptional regulator
MRESARQTASAREKRAAKQSRRAPAETPRRSQRERLLDAMIELSAGNGYQTVTVAQVSSLAGVSSATFYEQFADKEDCMLGAFRAAAARVFGPLRAALALPPGAQTVPAALAGLLGAVAEDPDAARVVFIEALAGGSQVREELVGVLERFERRTEELLDDPALGATLDVPAIALVGAVRSIVVRHLRTASEDLLPSLAADIHAWMQAYAHADAEARWSAGAHALLDERHAIAPSEAADGSPPEERLPRGRHGLSASVVARSQRTRIIRATAEVMLAKGYANATVTDIVAAAGVAREAFYQHFADKQQAFAEAQQYPTQYMLETCVAAYFAQDSWPRRVWSGLQTLLRLIAENPAQSHLRLVECYAAGPAAARRAEEITRSFTIFLEEGFRFRPQAQQLPRLCSQTIGGAVFEIIQRTVARGETARLPRCLPQLVYVTIAPFTGPREAIELLEQMRAQANAAANAPV